MRLRIFCAVVLFCAGCADRAIPRATVPDPPPPLGTRPLLAAADENVRSGCYDCLTDALTTYEDLKDDSFVGTQARERAVRTALLLAVRESELGLVPGDRIERARQLLGPIAQASPELPALVEIAEVIANGPVGFTRTATTDRQFAAMVTVSRKQQEWAPVLRALMPQDLTATYLWLGLACGPYSSGFPDADRRAAVTEADSEIPVIAYKTATACGLTASEPLEAQLALESRFGELNYHLGLFALGGQTGRPPDLDAADRWFRAAYAWRQDWPTLTLAMANVAISAEDFPRALEYYRLTMQFLPDDADALAGTIRALTYSGQHVDAIAVADRLLASGRNPGDAHYWRALNLARLKRDSEAWADIELAARALANADVPKLAGIIAINRRDFSTARDRLDLARRRRGDDCETLYYLQTVLSEQRQWDAAARTAAEAAACFDTEEANISDELAIVRASQMAPDRRERIIVRREQQLATDARLRATAWFNAAAANFNLSRTDEARRFAEKLADDAQLGERARSLLERLK